MLGFHTSNSNVEVVLHTSESVGGGGGDGFQKSFDRKIPSFRATFFLKHKATLGAMDRICVIKCVIDQNQPKTM